jgi:hypothetical protein
MEVQNILKSTASRRWNLGSTGKIYQADQHGYLPEVEKEKLVHCLIGLSVPAPDRCQCLSDI